MGAKRKFQHQGERGKRNLKKNTNNSSANQDMFGPVAVTTQDIGQKAFIFCHQKFKVLSKKELRNCFYKREVFLNNTVMEPGVKSEIYSIQLNDSFTIQRNLISLKKDELEAIPINIQYANAHFAVVHKLSGQSVSASNCNVSAANFEDAVCTLIPEWHCHTTGAHLSSPSPSPQTLAPLLEDNSTEDKSSSNSENTLHLLPQTESNQSDKSGHLIFRLEKSIEGLCLVARSVLDQQILTHMVNHHSLVVKFSCILAGAHGDVGSSCRLAGGAGGNLNTPSLEVKVVSITRCRSADQQSLSLVEVTVQTPAQTLDQTLNASSSLHDQADVATAATSGGGGAAAAIVESHAATSLKTAQSTDLGNQDQFTTLLRNVKKTLKVHGMDVVGGDDGLVRKDKGYFIALTHIGLHDLNTTRQEVLNTFGNEAMDFFDHLFQAFSLSELALQQTTTTDIDAQNGQCLFTMNIPIKFTKLLEKESMLYDAALNKDREKIRKHFESVDDESKLIDLELKYRQLEEGYPVEYLTNSAEFCGFHFLVTKDVMIPRKSSETLVHEVLSQISHKLKSPTQMCGSVDITGNEAMDVDTHCLGKNDTNDEDDDDSGDDNSNPPVISLLDIGVGSGCLLLASLLLLQKKFPRIAFRGVGVDICPKALAVAQTNATRLGIAAHVSLRLHSLDQIDTLTCQSAADAGGGNAVGDGGVDDIASIPVTTTPPAQQHPQLPSSSSLSSSLPPGAFDILLCNPPYSSVSGDAARLSSSRRTHEPALALFTGEDSAPTACFVDLARAVSRSFRGGERRSTAAAAALSTAATPPAPLAVSFSTAATATATATGNIATATATTDAPTVDSFVKGQIEGRRSLMKADAKLIVEFGHGQMDSVKEVFRRHAKELRFIRASTDCNKLQRCLVYAVK
jgi:methylase of polypeptide subunit release factors